jgi:L-asparagine transporter-like permease
MRQVATSLPFCYIFYSMLLLQRNQVLLILKLIKSRWNAWKIKFNSLYYLFLSWLIILCCSVAYWINIKRRKKISHKPRRWKRPREKWSTFAEFIFVLQKTVLIFFECFKLSCGLLVWELLKTLSLVQKK